MQSISKSTQLYDQMFNKVNTKLNLRSIRAIKDPLVLNFINKLFHNKSLNRILDDNDLISKFLIEYKNWI